MCEFGLRVTHRCRNGFGGIAVSDFDDFEDIAGLGSALSPRTEHWLAIFILCFFLAPLVVITFDACTGADTVCNSQCESIYLHFDDPVKHGLNECYVKCNWDDPKVYDGKTNPR